MHDKELVNISILLFPSVCSLSLHDSQWENFDAILYLKGALSLACIAWRNWQLPLVYEIATVYLTVAFLAR